MVSILLAGVPLTILIIGKTMPLRKTKFTIVQNDLQKIIDVDASDGRSVPINMNFIDEGYLSKDTGIELFGDVQAALFHSLFHYKKKNGTSYIIGASGTKLKVFNTGTLVWDNLSPTYTAGAEFGFVVYNDILYGCNAVESFFSWDGTTFTNFAPAPKGNILEVFEDRMFVTGVTAEPLTAYYSGVGTPTTFAGADLIKPLGTDSLTNLKNYYGTLLIFKQDSIWKLTFIYDQIVNLFVPKLEAQSGTYGACSRKAVSWVENDIWFFTGQEVRAIGFTDNASGVFGINRSVISDSIKETLKNINVSDYSKIVTFYNDRRFYLSVPLTVGTLDTVFVCHTLYKNAWTKYTGRDKARVNDFIAIDNVVYSTKASSTFGSIKWTAALNDISTAISSEVFFRRLEDKQFNRFRMFRYLDLMFKDLLATITVTIRQEASDIVDEKEKSFSVGNGGVGEILGEVLFGDGFWGGGVGATIEYSPFVKKRVSFLSKNQALIIGLANNEVDQTFTIAEFALMGQEEPERMFSSNRIISVV